MRPAKPLSRFMLSALASGGILAAVSLPARVAARPIPGEPRPAETSDPSPLNPASLDTVWFGGTRWDAADARWEAIRDSVWTFDSGVGSSINDDPGSKPVGLHGSMEGWIGEDLSRGTHFPGRFRRLGESDFPGSPCVGSATGVLGGDWSFWAGLRESEVPACWVGGRGYGSWWNVSIRQTFQATGSAVTFTYNYIVDCEDGYDFVTVYADAGNGPIPLKSYTGAQSGSEALVLTPGVHLPSGAGSVSLIFRFESDAVYDDQDGGWPTACGAFAVDDIALAGGIVHFADFESGADGWIETDESMPAGDFSDLEAMDDLSAPWVTMPAGCGPADSVLVFNDPGNPVDAHPDFQQNLAWSPWIDLAEEGLGSDRGMVFSAEGFFDQKLHPYSSDKPAVLVYLEVDWDPRDPCDTSRRDLYFNIEPARWFCRDGPFIKPLTTCGTPACRSLVPPGATRVRIGVGVASLCLNSSGVCTRGTLDPPTPWYDNIRLGVLRTAATGLGDPLPGNPRPFLGAVRPNPFRANAGVKVSFRLPERQAVLIEVLDVTGRMVARVFDGQADPGSHEVTWRGTDGTGRVVPGGIYFLRMTTREGRQVRKIVQIP